ncbi:MAG: hypothetical protein HOP15_02070 [Planctomycetes bacterium]|nr:hypothetical protein [Planctomycetota bacterium]
MKPAALARPLLLLVLPCAGFGAAWWLYAGRPQPTGIEPVPVRAPQLGARRALAPGVASPALEVGSADPRAAWVELNNEATAALNAGDFAGALAKFERCWAAEPENAVFTGNLAEALVRLARSEHERGELAPAVEHLARALELGGARTDVESLRRILERWRRELELGQDDWTDDSSRFELTFDTGRSDILHHSHEVLEHLEQSYDELVRWFGSDPLAGAPAIRVVLYEPEDFARLTGLGDWAAGLFDGVVRVSVRELTDGGTWRTVLVHELVHAFVRALGGPDVPGWLNEGVAQLLEGRAGEVARMRQRLRASEVFPLERLAGSLASWEDTAAIARAYAQSLVFADSLRASYGDEALRRMLDARALRLSPAAAFEQWTSVPLELAFQDWCATLEH